jgi:arginine decarboxylase
MVFGQPDKYFLVAAYAEGPTALNAFDNALLKSGVGNTNLIRVSSILPPSALRIKGSDLPPGALIPIAYASEISEEPGVLVSAAVAVGVPDDPKLPGVIVEHHMIGSEDECRQVAIEKVEAAFAARNFKLVDMATAACAGTVKTIGCAFAGVVLWK